MKEETQAFLNDLRDYLQRVGEYHFQRVTLARQILADRDWVHDPAGGGGNLDRALDRLQDQYLSDICTYYTLDQLLPLLDHYPSAALWQKYKCNFRRMKAEHSARERPTPNRPRPAAGRKPAAAGSKPAAHAAGLGANGKPVPQNGELDTSFPTPSAFSRMDYSEQLRWYGRLWKAYREMEKKTIAA